MIYEAHCLDDLVALIKHRWKCDSEPVSINAAEFHLDYIRIWLIKQHWLIENGAAAHTALTVIEWSKQSLAIAF